ncbi:acyl carrier protein [Streptomyces sp. YIM S03343]
MTSAPPWNARFETVLRQGLPSLDPGSSPEPDVPLESYGLDSLSLIGIVDALESAYGLTLTGQITVPLRVLTAAQLWDILSAALVAPRQPRPLPSPNAITA